MQEIIAQFAFYLYFLSCLRQLHMEDSLRSLTNVSHQIRVWFQAKPPNGGSFDGAQNDGAELSRVVYTAVHFDSRLMKAFDRIKHSSQWISLEHCGIETPYIDLLKMLYSHQEGTVLTDTERAVFPIRRGTKRGDPVSSLLFSTVLQFALKDDLKSWQEKTKAHD